MFPFTSISASQDHIGPDGLSDIGRDMKRRLELGNLAVAAVHAMVAERTGLDIELVPHLSKDYLKIALMCADLKNFQEIK